MSERALSGSRSSASKQGLAARRRTRRRRGVIALIILVLVLLGLTVYGLGQNAVRISHINIVGGDSSLVSYASSSLQGFYFHTIPRNSTFFFPENSIRTSILAADSSIAAISIERSGFNGLTITIDDRAPIALWCGVAPVTDVDTLCYVFDDTGTLFALAASTTQTINPFTLYAPLTSSSSDPIGSTIADSAELPAAFDFARQLATLGAMVTTVYIHDGEVDDFVASSTRITYILGDEQNAFTALVSASSNFNLTNGSIEYVDLRFDGRVYLMPRK
jgi:hypothetical protein